jgi:hypothetical protein
LELTLSLTVFCDAEQYCVLIVCSVFLQALLKGVFRSLLCSALRSGLSRVCLFLVLLLLMFSFLEHLSVASEVLAVKFYIAIF